MKLNSKHEIISFECFPFKFVVKNVSRKFFEHVNNYGNALYKSIKYIQPYRSLRSHPYNTYFYNNGLFRSLVDDVELFDAVKAKV